MKRILTLGVPSAALVLLSACATMGGEGQSQNRSATSAATAGEPTQSRTAQDAQTERSMQQTQSARSDETRPFAGRVVDLRTIGIGAAAHLVARLETRKKNDVLVDLGRISELRSQGLRLYWGERISGRAIPVHRGRRPVLAATRFTAGDQQLNISPRLQQRGAQGRQAMRQSAHVLLRGRIVDTRQVALRDAAQPHHLVKVRTRKGVTVADLGPHSPKALNLDQGDWVAIFGEPARISGKPVVLAQNVAEFTQLRR